MAFQRTFMYDGAVSDLQPIIPLTSEIEMKSDLNAILMMKRTKPTVNSLKLLLMTVPFLLKTCLTLSQFMVMLTSSNSKFDHYRRNEAGGSFTTDEAAGNTF
jgi:cytochrome c peroxidase